MNRSALWGSVVAGCLAVGWALVLFETLPVTVGAPVKALKIWAGIVLLMTAAYHWGKLWGRIERTMEFVNKDLARLTGRGA